MNPHPFRTTQDDKVDHPIQHKIRDICPYCLFEVKNERDHRLCGSPDFPERNQVPSNVVSFRVQGRSEMTVLLDKEIMGAIQLIADHSTHNETPGTAPYDIFDELIHWARLFLNDLKPKIEEDIEDIKDGLNALEEYYKNPENVIDVGDLFDLDDDAEPRLLDEGDFSNNSSYKEYKKQINRLVDAVEGKDAEPNFDAYKYIGMIIKLNSTNVSELIGKTIKTAHIGDGYPTFNLDFTDGTKLEVWAEDCFDFIAQLL